MITTKVTKRMKKEKTDQTNVFERPLRANVRLNEVKHLLCASFTAENWLVSQKLSAIHDEHKS